MRQRQHKNIVDRLVDKQQQLEKLEPSKPSSPKRRAKKKKKPNYVLWVAALFIIGLPLLANLYGRIIVAQRAQLPEQGVVTMGTVLDHRSEYYDGEFLTIQYDVVDAQGNQTRYIEEHSVSEAQYNSLPIGTAVEVIYLPNNPEVSDVYGNETTEMTTKIANTLRNNLVIASIIGMLIGLPILALESKLRAR